MDDSHSIERQVEGLVVIYCDSIFVSRPNYAKFRTVKAS